MSQAKLRSTASKNGISTTYKPSVSGEPSTDAKDSSASWREILARSLVPHAEWPEKDDLLDVVYWGRQILGAVLGIIWGLVPIHGMFGIAVYLLVTTLCAHVYVTSYQRQDEERFGGFLELAKEGFGSSMATFLVCWILVYTSMHAQDPLSVG